MSARPISDSMGRRLSTLLLTAAGTLALSGTAAAKPAPAPADCTVPTTLSQPFAPWGDTASYALAPGGNFESGAPGWKLTGGARIEAPNNPFAVAGPGDAASLLLPGRAVATSPPMCVDITFPYLRFFAAGASHARTPLRVEVLFVDAKGRVKVANHGQIRARSRGWLPTDSVQLGLRFDDTVVTQLVAFRFIAKGTGSWRIDDVYVDPFAKR
jgi:hypothetical protein